MKLPELNEPFKKTENASEDVFLLNRNQYSELLAKANAFELQSKCFQEVREELLPTEKDLHLPWYEMLAKCIKNRQLIWKNT